MIRYHWLSCWCYHFLAYYVWDRPLSFPDLKQVLQNVRSQLKLFTNVRSTIWGGMHFFLVKLQKDQKSDVVQTFWVVNFFRTVSDSSCIPSKIRCMTKTQWKSWALVATFCLLQVNCLPPNPLSCTWRCRIQVPRWKKQLQHSQRWTCQNHSVQNSTEISCPCKLTIFATSSHFNHSYTMHNIFTLLKPITKIKIATWNLAH